MLPGAVVLLATVASPAQSKSTEAEVASAEQLLTDATLSPLARVPEPYKFPKDSQVAIIRIDSQIYEFVLKSMQRRVERAKEQGANLIVFEFDTPGGGVLTALDICHYIKTLDMPTVAWINPRAYSAGIIISAACKAIVMTPVSVTGDSAPIMLGRDLSPTERAKALSPILAEVRDSAQRNGYDNVLFHAMCELGVEVYQVEHEQTGRRMLVNQADYMMMVTGKTRAQVEETLNLKGEDATNKKSPVIIEVATDADISQWKLVKHVHGGSTLLTMTQTEALDIGLSRAMIKNDVELKDWLGAASVVRIDQSWSEDLAGWLTHPVVRGVLILGLMVGAYMEFQSPGLGLPGAVAAGCLVVVLGSPFLIDLSKWWHVAVFFIGFALLVVEVFVTPGFGVFGITGLLLMFASLVLAVVPTDPGKFLPPARLWDDVAQQAVAVMVAGGIGIISIMLMFTCSGKLPMFNKLVLQTRQQAGMSTSAKPSVSGSEAVGSGGVTVGATGSVVAQLRPSGRAEVDGRLIDVVSIGDWIEAGQQVRVVEVHGNRIVVEPA